VPKIELRQVTKIFGPHPKAALGHLRAGMSKDELLAKTGHDLALCEVSLSVEEGEVFVVMGLSGSGKSTLIRHINRLIDPTEGEILIDGQNILKLSIPALELYRRPKMSMVFQNFGLFPHKTVLENVAYGLEIQRRPRAERRRRAEEWIETVGLAGYARHYPWQLSGGMRQRVGLARALCTDPEILLMDEPFSALDALTRAQMQDELMTLQARLRKTIVFITHDLGEALRLGERIAFIKDASMVQIGTPAEILNAPADGYVGAFVRQIDMAGTLAARYRNGTRARPAS
jgi:glycine betaine/proline transport system ATP-binding protein